MVRYRRGGYAFIYNGKTFTTITNNDGKAFANVRSIIKDKKGNMWLGGHDGLWRYDGKTFTNFTRKFVGNVYEDKQDNIWTTSERDNGLSSAPFTYDGKLLPNGASALYRYDGKSLGGKKPEVTEIMAKNEPFFGIVEANDGSIWFGAADGVYRYNGTTITDFKGKEDKK